MDKRIQLLGCCRWGRCTTAEGRNCQAWGKISVQITVKREILWTWQLHVWLKIIENQIFNAKDEFFSTTTKKKNRWKTKLATRKISRYDTTWILFFHTHIFDLSQWCGETNMHNCFYLCSKKKKRKTYVPFANSKIQKFKKTRQIHSFRIVCFTHNSLRMLTSITSSLLRKLFNKLY